MFYNIPSFPVFIAISLHIIFDTSLVNTSDQEKLKIYSYDFISSYLIYLRQDR